MFPAPRGGKPNRREGKQGERKEARSGAGELGPGCGPCRPHPTPGDFLPFLFLATSPWQPTSPSSSAPAPLPSPWRFGGLFFPPPSASHPSSHPNFPLCPPQPPSLEAPSQQLTVPTGDLPGCSSAPLCSRAGGTFPGPTAPVMGEGSGWSAHGASWGAQLPSPPPGTPSTSPSQRGGTEQLGSTHGSSAALGCRPQAEKPPGSRVTDLTCWGEVGKGQLGLKPPATGVHGCQRVPSSPVF